MFRQLVDIAVEVCRLDRDGDQALRVRVDASVSATLVEQYLAAEVEPCGLLFGAREEGLVHVRAALALPNVHPTPRRACRMRPEDQLQVIKEARTRNEKLVGTWHGHLEGGAQASRADVEDMQEMIRAGLPDLLVIVGRGTGRAPVIRGFRIGRREASEITLAL